MMNENAISNILLDVEFLEQEFKRYGRQELCSLFSELRSVRVPLSLAQKYSQLTASFAYLHLQLINIVMSDTVQEYLVPSVRQSSYAAVKPKRLQALLEKLARYGSQCRDAPSRDRGEKRRKEAEAVGKVYPGENR